MKTEEQSNVEDGAKAKPKFPAFSIAFGKDLVGLLRDLSLFVLVLLLLVFPTTFNSVLSNAGFEEGSFVGLKWKPKLLNSDAALREAQGLITDLREQNAKLSTALGEAQSKLSDPALKEQYAKLEVTNKQLTTLTSKVEDSVASTIAMNAPLLEKVLSPVDTNTKWGVVFGGEADLNSAQYEVGTVAQKFGIPNASIFLRQGSYRAVSVVGSESEAFAALAKAKGRRADSYMVNMSKWCPNSVEKNGYRECAAP